MNSQSKSQTPAAFIIDNADGDRVVVISGRDLWALERLIEAGERGCTPIDDPAPRWSGYVHNLRNEGIVIETIHEKHGGPFPGTHARYVLRSRVERLDSAEDAA